MAKNNGSEKYAYLNRLSTEQLEELLRADFELPERDDTDAILHILEVIEKREEEHPTGRLSDVDQMWADFQQYYNIPEGEGLSLYPTEDEEVTETALQPQSAKVVRLRPALKLAGFVAAVVVGIFGLMVTAQAAGVDVFGAIGRWTNETFHFVASPGPSQNDGTANSTGHMGEYESLQAALDDYEITEIVVPTWVADGFKLVSVTVTELPDFGTVDFNAYYENDIGGNISLSIIQREVAGSALYEKDDTLVTRHLAGDITHYIFDNNGRMVAAWYVGTLECSLKGDLSLANLEKMIDSIYER